MASALYIAGFMIFLGHYGKAKSIIAALVIVVIFFLMFEVWFKVPLPKGPIEALLGFQ